MDTIRLFKSVYDFLSHVTTSGRGRTKRVIIEQMNELIRTHNASPPSDDDDPLPPLIRITTEQLEEIYQNRDHRLIRLIWRMFNKTHTIELIRDDCPERPVSKGWNKLPLILELIKYGNPREHPEYIRRYDLYGGQAEILDLDGTEILDLDGIWR